MRTLNIDDLKALIEKEFGTPVYGKPKLTYMGSGVFADTPYYDFIGVQGRHVYQFDVSDIGGKRIYITRREMTVDYSLDYNDTVSVSPEGVRYD